MSFRKVIFWSHLVAGVGASLIIILLSVTGVLLTYETQITRWAEGGYDVSVGAAPLPADRLAEVALAETGGQASALVFSNDPEAAVLATSGRDGKLFLDPYSGATHGEGSTATGAFFTKVMFLHRWLSLSGRAIQVAPLSAWRTCSSASCSSRAPICGCHGSGDGA